MGSWEQAELRPASWLLVSISAVGGFDESIPKCWFGGLLCKEPRALWQIIEAYKMYVILIRGLLLLTVHTKFVPYSGATARRNRALDHGQVMDNSDLALLGPICNARSCPQRSHRYSMGAHHFASDRNFPRWGCDLSWAEHYRSCAVWWHSALQLVHSMSQRWGSNKWRASVLCSLLW